MDNRNDWENNKQPRAVAASRDIQGADPQVMACLRRLIDANGPLRFDTYMEAVLYGEGGFYASDTLRTGKTADFVTSIELGPRFSWCVARAIQDWFVRTHAESKTHAVSGVSEVRLVDIGGGGGKLARDVRDVWHAMWTGHFSAVHGAADAHVDPHVDAQADPAFPVGSPTPTERSFSHSRAQVPSLTVAVVDTSPAARAAARAEGLLAVASWEELPFAGNVIVAHELFDNLPARLLYRGKQELRVGMDSSGVLQLYAAPLTKPLARFRAEWDLAGSRDARLTSHGERAEGKRGVVPVPVGACSWIAEATRRAVRPTFLLAVDYGDDVSRLADREDWPVRAYQGQREVDPLDLVGKADVTCDVPVDVITRALCDEGWDTRVFSQAAWLQKQGIHEMDVALLREEQAAALARQTMRQLQAKSVRNEIRALTDPAGFGGFVVWEASRAFLE